MKKLLIILALIVGSIGANAQERDIAFEINKLEQAVAKAILKQDTLALKKLWAPDMMVNAPLNKVVVGGHLKMVASGFIKYSSLVVENEKTLVKENIVITMGKETIITLGGNYPEAGNTVQCRYTNIWEKQNGSWLMIARQASNICE